MLFKPRLIKLTDRVAVVYYLLFPTVIRRYFVYLNTLPEDGADGEVVGGHTVKDQELKFGCSVTGTVHPDRVIRNRRKLEAIAVQHEIDHLDGVLLLDRISSLKTDLIRRADLMGNRNIGESA